MSIMSDAMGRDLHHLGVAGDLPAIAHKLVEMGWFKTSLFERPRQEVSGVLTLGEGAIVVQHVGDPVETAHEVSRQIEVALGAARPRLGYRTDGIR